MNIVTRGARFASVDLLLDRGYLWLARDLNGSIAAYSHKPFKLDGEVWRVEEGESKEMWMWVDDGDLYNFVKWEDDKPVNIREWLEKEEEEMKMYSVKDGELEGREVDADFFEKNTTLGGLLAPKEVELDRDNRIVTDRATIVDDNYMLKTNGQILDVASVYPPLTFEKNPVTHEFICDELYETYKKKNADYGNSFEISLDKHGLIAAIVRMDDKMNRVINLYKADERMVEDESVRDTLMDLANYAIMSVMWLDNKSGKESDGGSNYDIYADNQKLPGADYDGDTTNS